MVTERNPPAILVAIAAMFLACGHALRADADVPNQTKQGSSTADATITRLNLPDSLIMNDGQPVTTVAQWRTRREEMKKILLENFIGEMPPAPGNVEGTVTASTPVLGGKVMFRQIDLKFGPDQKLTLKIAILTPVGAGPVSMPIL